MSENKTLRGVPWRALTAGKHSSDPLVTSKRSSGQKTSRHAFRIAQKAHQAKMVSNPGFPSYAVLQGLHLRMCTLAHL
jgi:hypothetical protein